MSPEGEAVVLYTMRNAARNQPLNGLLEVLCSCAFSYSRIHEFLVILFGKLWNDTAENLQNASAVNLAVMLGEIVLIDGDEFILNLADALRILMPNP